MTVNRHYQCLATNRRYLVPLRQQAPSELRGGISSVAGGVVVDRDAGAAHTTTGHTVVPMLTDDHKEPTAEELRFPYLLGKTGTGWRPPETHNDKAIGPSLQHYVTIRLDSMFKLTNLDQRRVNGTQTNPP